MLTSALPVIIQGGMGAGVSDWRLARAVSVAGQLGVVSGTALDVIMVRRLQLGDPGGHTRRALEQFPIPGVARRILDRYFLPDGKPVNSPFKSKPLPSEAPSRSALELLVASNFVEVFLSREGHDAPVGINYLEKIQVPTLPSLYGAMLAGVSCVLMGAGIPRAIPGAIDCLVRGESVEIPIDVHGAGPGDRFVTRFDPAVLWPEGAERPTSLNRPDFYAIVSSATLAVMLTKKASGRIDGFIIEGPTAGGHNAPPRGPARLTADGQPIYGERDIPDLEAIRSLGLPFWLAGSYARPERVAEALSRGAAGVQVGTAFAYCEESGLAPEIKEQVLALSRAGELRVFTDPVASPTGFPFKLLRLPGTPADPASPARSPRLCDLGYLRHAYKKPEGTVGWRCAAEPVQDYVQKGGAEADTRGRMCVCNGLLANIGLGQVRGEHGEAREMPLVTSGDDAVDVARFLKPGTRSYHAADVVEYLLQGVARR
ncbi:MAG: nitronate monooxygenase [Phycisphaerales bacterium]|nr:nitronate monooxygenase [Phycisphaerales bacterium]